MAKVSKSLLKEIVKECLVEILAEGLTGGNSNKLEESVSKVKSNSQRIPEEIRQMKKSSKSKNKNFENTINESIKNATSDPMMAEIFADTAKTTLQEQIEADNRGHKPVGNDSASKLVANNNLEDLFGNASNNWANLAFSSSNKK